jgi:hypothetical protein
LKTRKLSLNQNARFTSANHTPQNSKNANLPHLQPVDNQQLISVEFCPLKILNSEHEKNKKMTDSSEPHSISTQGSYSPPVQKSVAQGNKEYALKNYDKAVEHYGEASELQSTLPILLTSSTHSYLLGPPSQAATMTPIFYSSTAKHSSKSPRKTPKY